MSFVGSDGKLLKHLERRLADGEAALLGARKRGQLGSKAGEEATMPRGLVVVALVE